MRACDAECVSSDWPSNKKGQTISHQRYASYPWYDISETRPDQNAFWTGLRDAFLRYALSDVPLSLDRSRPYGVDPDGDCFFTQTCSYTLFTTARKQFTVLGAPGYTAEGCKGPYHKSWIVTRDVSYVRGIADLRDKRFAINEMNSNSGMNLPRHLFAQLANKKPFFAETIVTGSHLLSADAVSRGAVDAAAIDCVTFALLERYRPMSVKRLRIIGETASTPTPPFVTSRSTRLVDVASMKSALEAYFNDPRTAGVRSALLLDGIGICDESVYSIVPEYEKAAEKAGYPVLR